MTKEEYLAKLREKRKTDGREPGSVLDAWRDDILWFREHGCTLKEIADYLAENGVEAKIQWLSKYIRRHQGTWKTTPPKPKVEKIENPVKVASPRFGEITTPAQVAQQEKIDIKKYK